MEIHAQKRNRGEDCLSGAVTFGGRMQSALREGTRVLNPDPTLLPPNDRSVFLKHIKKTQSLAKTFFSQNVTSIKAIMWEPATTICQEPSSSHKN